MKPRSKALSLPRRLLGFAAWVVLYAREVVKANVALIRILFTVPDDKLHPGFFVYDVSDLAPFEILALSHLITLTPGTTSSDLLDGGHSLVVHAIDLQDAVAARRDIDLNLKEPLLRWTRS